MFIAFAYFASSAEEVGVPSSNLRSLLSCLPARLDFNSSMTFFGGNRCITHVCWLSSISTRRGELHAFQKHEYDFDLPRRIMGGAIALGIAELDCFQGIAPAIMH